MAATSIKGSREETSRVRTDKRVIIVGAGISGLGMARRMKLAGIPFTVLEKAPQVGGTWWHNTYPGLQCDVPVLAYRYSFEPLAGNSQSLLPTGGELQARVERLCDDNGLRPHVRLGVEVVAARWEDTRWVVKLSDGDTVEGEILVCATGFLHHPYAPEIPGMDSFRGPVVHAARWDPEVSVDGKRVAVIGSGSTGCQLVPAFAGRASRTFMFARNPQWVLPVPDLRVPTWLTRLLNRFPALDAKLRTSTLAAIRRLLGEGSSRNGWERRLFSYLCRRNLKTVKDPELRAALTPTDPPLCKRPVMTTSFYPAIQRPDVQLVREKIETITERGIRTVDGTEHELDVIVLATGYKAQAYMRPIDIVGEDGVTLEEEWKTDPYGYHSLALPGFPNMFMTYGPLSPRLHIGVHESVELLGEYVVDFIRTLEQMNAVSMHPSREATAEWVDRVRAAAMETTLVGCTSWYQGSDGAPLVYTLPREQWREDTGRFDVKDFVVRRRSNEASAA